MKKLIFGIVLLIGIGAAVLLTGCAGRKPFEGPETIEGGVRDDSDYNAPKEITSEELTSFKTEFFRYGGLIYKTDRKYRFNMAATENGGFLLTEDSGEAIQCETDAAFAQKLQQIISDYQLVRNNGIKRHTAGLPPEYAPYWLKAEYASGETLSFSMNGDPLAQWTGAVLDLFAKEFGSHGIEDLLPPKETSPMTRFSLEYTDGGVRYSYGEVWIPVTEEEKQRTFEDVATNGYNYDNCVRKVYSDPWDLVNSVSIPDKRRADPTEAYYQGLQKIVEDMELCYFQNGEIIPSNFKLDEVDQYYEFYIEYANGNRMSGFSDDPAQWERFMPVAEALSAYVEDYLEENRD